MTNWRRMAAAAVVAVGLLTVSPRADSPYQVIYRSQTYVAWTLSDWTSTLYGSTYSPSAALTALTPDGQYFWSGAAPAPIGRVFATPLVQGWDGRFYGIGDGDGTHAVAFSVEQDLQTTYQPVYTFTGGVGSFIQGDDGNFYGTTNTGGLCNTGVVFQLTPDGTFTPVHDICGAGAAWSTLVQGGDSWLYGITDRTIWRMATDGSGWQELYTFSPPTRYDRRRIRPLTSTPDGHVYGTLDCSKGPVEHDNRCTGNYYEVQPDGTIHWELGHYTWGGNYDCPAGYPPLAQGADGLLYTVEQMVSCYPTLIVQARLLRIDPTAWTSVWTWPRNDWGSGLVPGPDGALYGTVSHVGATGTDTFRFVPPPVTP
jgi:uncharacterized repeat protein (TIGR03803 family)